LERHPDHEVVAEEVRGWYTSSTPEIGLRVIRESFGFLGHSDQASLRRLVLTVDDPLEVADALGAAAEFYGGSEFEVWVDDRARAERLSPALGAVGRHKLQDTVILALVGAIRTGPAPEGLAVEDVAQVDGLREWARVKLQGFADDEQLPVPDRVEEEIEGRKREWIVCRYQLGRLRGEAVSVLGHYIGADQMVFNLATRVPYRHLGIAQAMLAQWTKQAEVQAARSLLINCDDAGRAAVLYRRLGFTDEIYWHRRYGRSVQSQS
jgi:GNAT superfamily N-acetyltransferase